MQLFLVNLVLKIFKYNIIILFLQLDYGEPAARKGDGEEEAADGWGSASIENRNTIQNQIDLKFLAYEVHLIFKNPRNQFIGAGICMYTSD